MGNIYNIEEGYGEMLNTLKIDLKNLKMRAVAHPSKDLEFQIAVLEEDINTYEKTYKQIKMNKNKDIVSTPPFVVNDIHPFMTNEEIVDWGTRVLEIPRIHSEFGLTGKGVRVAVIDTYIDPNHSDIVGAIVNPGNVTSETNTTAQNQNGHGQGSSGVIGARKNDGGILGVAPDCTIIPIKALSESGSGSMDDIARAINEAVDKNVHIINLSLGGGNSSPALKAAVDRATSAGIYIVASAGNSGSDNSVGYPAKFPNVYAVAATNQAGRVSAFSSRGNEVDIAAPGERILTTWKNNTYATVSGTSFSAPYVSGCFALFVNAGIKITMELLKETAIDIEEVGLDVKSGYGLINPYKIISSHYKPPVKVCDVPTGINIGNITENSAEIMWSSVPGNEYIIHYRENNSTEWMVVKTKNGNIVLSSLKSNQAYDVALKAVCGNISSELGPLFQIVTRKPQKPISLDKAKQAYDLLGQFINDNK